MVLHHDLMLRIGLVPDNRVVLVGRFFDSLVDSLHSSQVLLVAGLEALRIRLRLSPFTDRITFS